MITGKVFGRGTATTQTPVRVDYIMVKPDKSSGNLAIVGTESRRWTTTAERFWRLVADLKIQSPVASRATFCEEVLAAAGEELRTGANPVMVVQATDGRILGVTEYFAFGDAGYIHLQAVDPDHIPGSPGNGQLRGIGSSLIAAVGHDLIDMGVTKVYVRPLDDEAARFWRNRGFQQRGIGPQLVVEGRSALQNLTRYCEVVADRPEDGEILVCGVRSDTAAVRLPARR